MEKTEFENVMEKTQIGQVYRVESFLRSDEENVILRSREVYVSKLLGYSAHRQSGIVYLELGKIEFNETRQMIFVTQVGTI